MSAALDFHGQVRRLELALDGAGRACGRWRGNAVALEESGRLRVSLLSELREEAAEEALPPRAPTSIPELWIRSGAPSRLLQILDRPELREQVTALLSSVETLEVRDQEVVFRLVGREALPALKHTLDGAVQLAETVQRELAHAPQVSPAPSPGVAPRQVEPALIVQTRERNRRLRRVTRVYAALVGTLGAAVVPLWIGGHPGGSVVSGFLAAVGIRIYLGRVELLGAPACPECGAYLPLLFSCKRCPRCDLVLE